jgi:uroporphyrinogen decarboxylase
MGIKFDILEKEGPVLPPMTTMDDVHRITSIDPKKSTPFIEEAFRALRKEVGNEATVLGFVGLPFTLATYLVEGGSSTEYRKIKTMAYQSPDILHEMLNRLAQNIADYAIFQIESGAQVIQIFDSWAGNLSPLDYDLFAAPYQRKVVEIVKKHHPEVPIIMYINKSGALLERMAASGVDIVSLDWTVTIAEAKKRIGDKIGIQGNLDPMILFAPNDVIKTRTEEILLAGGGKKHVMNLGHGIDPGTPEDKAKFFIDTVRNFKFK